jgi:hypothetical protein
MSRRGKEALGGTDEIKSRRGYGRSVWKGSYLLILLPSVLKPPFIRTPLPPLSPTLSASAICFLASSFCRCSACCLATSIPSRCSAISRCRGEHKQWGVEG